MGVGGLGVGGGKGRGGFDTEGGARRGVYGFAPGFAPGFARGFRGEVDNGRKWFAQRFARWGVKGGHGGGEGFTRGWAMGWFAQEGGVGNGALHEGFALRKVCNGHKSQRGLCTRGWG